MRIGGVLVPIAFVLALLAACGSSVIAKADFITRGNAICKATQASTAAIALPAAINASAPDLSGLVGYFNQLLPIGRSQLSELTALGEPDSGQDAWAQALSAQGTIVADVEAARAAAQSGNLMAYQAAVNKSMTDGQMADQLMSQFGMTGCAGVSPGTSGGAPSSGAPSGAGQGGTFSVQVHFTGADAVQGSFTMASNGLSCADYVTQASPFGSVGFGPNGLAPVQIGGTSVTFTLVVPGSVFHGAGTYTSVMDGLSVGSHLFTGTDSTMTINGDGSGQASFTNLSGTNLSGNAPVASKSGTMSWACSG